MTKILNRNILLYLRLSIEKKSLVVLYLTMSLFVIKVFNSRKKLVLKYVTDQKIDKLLIFASLAPFGNPTQSFMQVSSILRADRRRLCSLGRLVLQRRTSKTLP